MKAWVIKDNDNFYWGSRGWNTYLILAEFFADKKDAILTIKGLGFASCHPVKVRIEEVEE